MNASARHTDPSTSHSAATVATLFNSALQQEVFETFKSFERMTDKTLNELFSDRGYAESTVRKRRSELTEMGLIKDSGEREGRHAVWELA
jgi:DNA-binding transcriptional ArsR family regulator